MEPALLAQTTELRQGSRGPAVQALQARLVRLGYDVGAAGADAIFGDDTRIAVERFQRANNLQPTGVVDATTQAALDQATPPVINPFIVRGSIPEQVSRTFGTGLGGGYPSVDTGIPGVGRIEISSSYFDPDGHGLKRRPQPFIASDRPNEIQHAPANTRYNIGTDYLVTTRNNSVGALLGGTVNRTYSQPNGYGNVVEVRTNTTFEFQGKEYPVYSHYAHLDRIDVQEGHPIAQGQSVGIMGNTGASQGAHVDFRLWIQVDNQRVEISPNLLNQQLRQRATQQQTTPTPQPAPQPTPPAVSAQQAITFANAAQTLLDKDTRAVTRDDGRRVLDGSSYDIKRNGATLSVEAEGRGEIFRLEAGNISVAKFTPQDLNILNREAFRVNNGQYPTVAQQPISQPPTATPPPTATAATLPPPVERLFQGGTVALGSLSAQQSYALAKAVFGDSHGARALIALDQQNGGRGTLVQRMIALGRHEGALVYGRQNPDPASGNNVGTFQIGGVSTSPADSRAKFERNLEAGLRIYNQMTGQRVNASQLNAADRDVIAHIGYIHQERNPAFGNLFQRLADSSLSRAQEVRLMSTQIQGGISDIGESVHHQRQTLMVNLDAVNARQQEPLQTRQQYAMPTLSEGHTGPAVETLQRSLQQLGYDLGRDGADGNFGANTEAAVTQYQRDHGIRPTGTAGPLTWQSIAENLQQRQRSEVPPTPTPVATAALTQANPGQPFTEETAATVYADAVSTALAEDKPPETAIRDGLAAIEHQAPGYLAQRPNLAKALVNGTVRQLENQSAQPQPVVDQKTL